MGARKRIKNEKIVEVFKKKACNISATCSALDIDRKTFYAWKKKDANLAEMLDEACEALIDNAETMLLSKLNEGDLPVNEWKFLFGGYYKDGCGVLRRMEGVRKALCYFAYARFVLQHSTNVTPFGVVSKMGDDSSAVDLRALTSLSSEARKIGEEYLSGTLAYWNEVRAVNDFNPGPKKAKRRFLAIGD